MSSSKIKHLKAIVEGMAAEPSTEGQIDLLTKGFELFSEETARLDTAYGALSQQFRQVNQKLEETNSRLANKVQELHVLTSYLDNILSHMAQGLLFIDLEGNVTTYNQSAEEILGKPKNQVLFQNFLEQFTDDVLGYSLKEALKKKVVPKISYSSLEFSDGTRKILEIENTFLLDKPTASQGLDFTQGVIVLIRDITELRQLQINASRHDRLTALGELAAQVAHEIRNPLGGIKGFAALLERDLANDPDKKRLAAYIVEGANTLDRLVAQVLNYSRPVSLDFKEEDLGKLLTEWKEALLAQALPHHKISLSIKPKDPLLLLVDKALLKLALTNLANNAFQAMEKGGTLSIKLLCNDAFAEIQIKDTGYGIPQENLKKLFSPFFSTKADGNGLGLAEVHKVVQAHGGEITTESEVGKWTLFTIKLPLKG